MSLLLLFNQGSVSGTLVSDADSAAGTEGWSITATLTGSETGAGTDAGTLSASLSGSETGSGADAGSLSVSLTVTDTGSGADAGTLSTSRTVTDTGSGADAGALSAALSGSETSTGTEGALTLSAALTAFDTGSGVDADATTATVDGSDTGSGGDDGSAAAGGSDQDIDGGLDISYSDDQVTDRGVHMLDTGTGIEGVHAIEYLVHQLSDSDSAQGFDMHVLRFGKGQTLLSIGLSGKPGGDGRRLGGER